jgi:glycosyltransferase involved in cell wall biosynthesis
MISAVIPYYDRRDTIDRAIRSLVNLPCLTEVVVVDDEMTRTSSLFLHGLKFSFPKLRVVVNTLSKGAQGARVTGATQALNDFVVFLDSDDEACIQGIYKCIHALQMNSQASIAYGNVGLGGPNQSSDFLRVNGYVFELMLKNLSLCPFSGMCIKKSLIPWHSLDLNLPSWQDDDFIVTSSRVAEIVFVDTITAIMHWDQANRISQNKEKQLKGLVIVVRRWRSMMLVRLGWPRLFLWYMRVANLYLSCLIERYYGQNAAGMMTAVELKARVLPLKATRLLMAKAYAPFFDRIYV